MSYEEVGQAPEGLAFVQAFVNTGYHSPAEGIDPLSTLATAQAWLDAAVTRYGPRAASDQPITLGRRDVDRLRSIRRALTDHITHGPRCVALTAEVRIGIDGDGRQIVETRGSGAGQVLSLLLTEVFLAQLSGAWPRLKICQNDKCAIAFFDRSPNASAAWHNAKRCGNAVNLRRSRARRRTGPGASEGLDARR